MKQLLIFNLLVILILISCKSDKDYSEYNEADFIEVQGIIESAYPIKDPFDSPTEKNIRFKYFLDREVPLSGIEKNLDMFEAKKGYPLIVLVHKDNENISFYGRVGILESLNENEKRFLTEFFKK